MRERTSADRSRDGGGVVIWLVVAVMLVGLALAMTLASPQFAYVRNLEDMPILPMVAGLVVAGLVYQCVPWLVRATLGAPLRRKRLALIVMVFAGLAMRLVLVTSEPVLEDDYHRYLWDGAVTASGMNPYAVPPLAARQAAAATKLGQLAKEAGPVLERVNHPTLRTVYPPVAQAFFAVAYWMAPFRLEAWRAICLAGDVTTLALILALLREARRSALWATLYWWNPVVVKEVVNSAHMEAIVVPLVLAALLLAARRRPLAATGLLGLAMGAKLWPIMLAPLVLRPLLAQPARLVAALTLTAVLTAAWAAPVLLAGIDTSSGFVAYAQKWQTASALFPILQRLLDGLLGLLGVTSLPSGLIARGLLAAVVASVAAALARRPVEDAGDLMRRAGLVVATLLLLSPAQFPWYTLWLAPFLAFLPLSGFVLLTMTIQLYYLAFHFLAIDAYEHFRTWVVWLIWGPVWLLLAIEARRVWRAPLAPAGGGAG
ncbi:MAG: glycosyltransferase 87 family protein [Hyphomicrobiaceae bacterium]